MFLYQFIFFWLLLVIWLILALATMVLLIFGPFLRRNFFKEKLGHLLLRSLLVLGLGFHHLKMPGILRLQINFMPQKPTYRARYAALQDRFALCGPVFANRHSRITQAKLA